MRWPNLVDNHNKSQARLAKMHCCRLGMAFTHSDWTLIAFSCVVSS